MGQSGPSLPYSLLAPVAPASHRGRLAAPRIRAWRVASRCAKPKFRASPISLTAWKAPPPPLLSPLTRSGCCYVPHYTIHPSLCRSGHRVPSRSLPRRPAGPLPRLSPALISSRAAPAVLLPYCSCPTVAAPLFLPYASCPAPPALVLSSFLTGALAYRLFRGA